MDLDGSQMEMRISRLMNESVDPKFFLLQERHTRLKEKNDKLVYEQKLIRKESERVNDLNHNLTREIQNCLHEKKVLQLMLYDINLWCEK
jgi:hypothetical protein